jgi:23S rRNA (uracil1939-C5)-methyltransferase
MRAFVSGGVPGDLVKIRTTKLSERHLVGEVAEILAPSKLRRPSPCQYSDRCGGCDLIEVEDLAQLSLKHELLCRTMAAGSVAGRKWSPEEIAKVKPVVAGPFWEYRNRVALHVGSDGAVGFYRRGTQEIVPISDCLVTTPAIRKLLKRLKAFGEQLKGMGFRLAIHDTNQAEPTISAEFNAPLSGAVRRELTKKLNGLTAFWSIWEAGLLTRSSFPTNLVESNSAALFSQINYFVNQLVTEYIRTKVALIAAKRVWDLYGGSGNFGFQLLTEIGQLLLVEADQRLCQLAQERLKQLSYNSQVRIKNQSVEKFLRPPHSETIPDLIILDPPRSGLEQAAKLLPKASYLILINCHLPSFFRDASNLDKLGWRLEEVAPFDMFPQTSYLETVSFWRLG